MRMELEGNLFISLRPKTQILISLQDVSVVDGATHTQKYDVESNASSSKNGVLVKTNYITSFYSNDSS